MIAALLEADHQAGREVFAAVGNAPQQSWTGRGEDMRGLAALWEAHTGMIEQTILPHLPPSERLAVVREGNRRIAAMAADLARRAGDHDADHHWLADFEELRRQFDAQCSREDIILFTLLRDSVPAPQLAEMTLHARAMRWANRRTNRQAGG